MAKLTKEQVRNAHRTIIIHTRDDYDQLVWVSDPHGNKTTRHYLYMMGQVAPRYPVPAVPIEAIYTKFEIWDSETKQICERVPCVVIVQHLDRDVERLVEILAEGEHENVG